jgi:hypothetical protein
MSSTEELPKDPDPALPVQVVPGLVRHANSACPVCANPILVQSTNCNRCETPHHPDCWTYNDGCGIYACAKKQPTPPARVQDAVIVPKAMRTAWFMGVIAAILAPSVWNMILWLSGV